MSKAHSRDMASEASARANRAALQRWSQSTTRASDSQPPSDLGKTHCTTAFNATVLFPVRRPPYSSVQPILGSPGDPVRCLPQRSITPIPVDWCTASPYSLPNPDGDGTVQCCEPLPGCRNGRLPPAARMARRSRISSPRVASVAETILGK